MDELALRQEFGHAQKEAQDLISAAAAAKRTLTAEEKAANDARYARMDTIRALFDEKRRFAAMQLDAGQVITPTPPQGKQEFDRSEGQPLQFRDAAGNLNLAAVKEGLRRFGRSGDMRQVFTVTTGTASGAFLPKEVLQPVTVRRLQNCFRGILAAYDVEAITIDSVASFSIPVADDTSNTGQSASESSTTASPQDPSESDIAISPTLWDSKAFWYSNTMVNAGTFDVVSYTLPMAQKRIQKIQESTWTNNVMTNGTVGKTTASATAITYAELLAWEHSLAPAYRIDAGFAVSDSLYLALRGLVDNNNRPIMDEDPSNTWMAKIHGKPVVIGDYFQTLAANHVVGCFVSADAIKIVDVNDARLARYSNLPTYPDQIGFQMFQNGDFGFVSNGLSLLKSAIS